MLNCDYLIAITQLTIYPITRLLVSRGPESAGAALGVAELRHFDDRDLNPRAHDHLGNLHPRFHRKSGRAVVDQDHADLAAIAFVDRPRRVEHRDGMLQREAAARPHLR